MPEHRVLIARAFQIVGLGTALPSAVMALTMGVAAFMVATPPAARKPDYISVTTYGLVGLLTNAMSGAGEVLSFLNGLAVWAFGLIAALALVAALFGGLLFRVGQGLDGSALWARLLAGAMMVALSLVSLPAFFVFRGAGRLACLAALAVSIYGLWVLSVRYSK